MKRTILRTLCAFALAGVLALPAVAQDSNAKQEGAPQEKFLQVKVAILDMEQIDRSAKVFQDIERQVQDYRRSIQAEIQKEEESLRTANQELGRQRTLLSPEAFAEERQKFEKRLIEMQRKVQFSKRELLNVKTEADRKATDVLRNVLKDVANQHNLTLVLRKTSVWLSADAFDITPLILKTLDERISAVKVSAPAKNPPPGFGEEPPAGEAAAPKGAPAKGEQPKNPPAKTGQ